VDQTALDDPNSFCISRCISCSQACNYIFPVLRCPSQNLHRFPGIQT